MSKNFQNQIDSQFNKISSLIEKLTQIYEINLFLQDKLDKAYLQIKDMVTKIVEATGGVKIIGSN